MGGSLISWEKAKEENPAGRGFWRTIEKMVHLMDFIEYIWLSNIIKRYLNIIQYRGKVLALLALILVLSPTPHIVL